MPLDELGIDPYQRAAVTFSRRILILTALTLPAGVACYKYGQSLGSEGDRLVRVGLALLIFSIFMCMVGYRRLRSENLEIHMLCLPGP